GLLHPLLVLRHQRLRRHPGDDRDRRGHHPGLVRRGPPLAPVRRPRRARHRAGVQLQTAPGRLRPPRSRPGPPAPVRRQGPLAAGGLALGLLAYWGYDRWKFPPGTTADHPRLLAQYVPAFPGDPVAGTLGLLFSPAASIFLYCPTVVLGLAGLAGLWRAERAF